jgi:transglutaminase-like putative cysteine protease
VAGGGAAVLILIVALLMPYVTYNDAVWFFWDRYGSTLKDFYDQLDRAFAGRNPVPEPTPGGPGISGHSLRTTGTLSEDVVLIVETSDPAPPPPEELEMILDVEGATADMFVPRHYWRQRTYDLYTGHGWESSQREDQVLPAGQTWRDPSFPHTVLTQTYRLVRTPAGRSSVLGYGVNEPVRVESDYRVYTRGEGDLAAFSLGPLDSEEPTYTVVSWVPDVYADTLQAAEGDYEAWIAERYLQLPDTLPARVRDLASQVVSEAEATTRHEMATAIERSIRALEYDLDLEPPPLDADVVDYFLFDAKRGYCDYSATAMVVMLRSLGVAARYASGYHMGSYDYGENGWVVKEANAHAWTEVYYPGIGWIEYEPTPSQRVFYRPPSPSSVEGLSRVSAAQETSRSRVPLWVWAAGLGVIVLFVGVWPPRWIRRARRDPRQRVWRTYGRLIRRARWAGLGPSGGQTPHEYLSALSRFIGDMSGQGGPTTDDLSLIERIYLRARYSHREVTEEEGDRVEGAWRRVRGVLTRFMFAGTRRRRAARARLSLPV